MRLVQGFLLLALLGVAVSFKFKDGDNFDDDVDYILQGDVEIVGYGVNCDEKGSFCDKKVGLVCGTLGQCECDLTKGLTFVSKSNKCIEEDDDDNVESNVSVESSEEATKSETNKSEKSDDKIKIEPLPEKPIVKPIVQIQPRTNKQETSASETGKEVKSPEKPRASVGDDVVKEPGSESLDWFSDQDGDDTENWNLPSENDSKNKDSEPEIPHQTCTSNTECQNSNFGKYSRCNPDTTTCECFDTQGTGKGVLLVDKKCYPMKDLGEVCVEHEECDAVINGGAWCHNDLERGIKYCTCQAFYIWDAELKECLPIATNGLDSPCKRDYQCSAHEALGRHSMCSEVTGLCECSNSLVQEIKNIFFFQSQCVEEKDFNETCLIDQECMASLGMDSICHPETQTCACIFGGSCEKVEFFRRYSYEQPDVSGFTLTILGFLGVSVLMAGLFCIVSQARKNMSYSYVRQQNEV